MTTRNHLSDRNALIERRTAEITQAAARPSEGPGMDTTLEELRCRYPTIPMWHGQHTGSYWAMWGGQLVEAITAQELGNILDNYHAVAVAHRQRQAR